MPRGTPSSLGLPHEEGGMPGGSELPPVLAE